MSVWREIKRGVREWTDTVAVTYSRRRRNKKTSTHIQQLSEKSMTIKETAARDQTYPSYTHNPCDESYTSLAIFEL